MRLTDKVAIITGGAAGIGRAYAEGFAREGARLIIADIDDVAAQKTAQSLTERGHQVMAVKTDVSREADTLEMAHLAVKMFGRIDILVNNAAMFIRNPAARAPVCEMELSEWEKVIAVNLTGVFLCCRAVLPYMIKQKSGKIINIASSLAFLGSANFAHYSASKGGVLTFTRALAREVGDFNINVNSLCPGYTLSMDLEDIPEDRRNIEISARIIKRPEYPEDLVGAAIFLASSDSDFMTGQAVVVDGGVFLH